MSLVRAGEPPARQMLTGGARLGTIPDYAGPPSTQNSGADDLIVRIDDREDDREIGGIDDFMAVLSEAMPGERATVKVERDGELMEFEVIYGGQR